jgi:hypothetical protein
LARGGLLPINLTAMLNPVNCNEAGLVVNGVKNPINPYPQLVSLFVGQLLGTVEGEGR